MGALAPRWLAINGLWIGGEMTAAGLARVGITTVPCRSALLKREDGARRLQRGLWGIAAYVVGDADDPKLAERAGRYAAVEGKVLSVGQGRRVFFLNFGKNWSKDLTAILYGTDKKSWKASAIRPKDLAGTSVRLRGWLEARDGALIRIDSPAQIERLDAGGDEARAAR